MTSLLSHTPHMKPMKDYYLFPDGSRLLQDNSGWVAEYATMAEMWLLAAFFSGHICHSDPAAVVDLLSEPCAVSAGLQGGYQEVGPDPTLNSAMVIEFVDASAISFHNGGFWEVV